MQNLQILVLTPPSIIDPALAIAACRAGALGMLDAEFAHDADAALAALDRLDALTSTPYGIKVDSGDRALIERLAGAARERLSTILVAGGGHHERSDWAGRFRAAGTAVLVECVSIEEFQSAQEIEADGVVLKGQEAGGRVGAETAYILLQRCMQHLATSGAGWRPAVYVQGGVGPHVAAACAAAGAAGVVLDAQLLATRESPLAVDRRQIAALDGSETLLVGQRVGETYRVLTRPLCTVIETLQAEEDRIARELSDPHERAMQWRTAVRRAVDARRGGLPLMLGQDAALAKRLAERCVTVGGVVEALARQVRHNVDAACRIKPLSENAALATSHGTRYPLLQGPMTRVSDTAAFADAVSHAGALPFLALAMLRKGEVEKLLRETRALLGKRAWGVGILGFLPPEIRKEQLAAVHDVKPPFALIAGGRPDQARELEQVGIPTYLHVPSPRLLQMFLKDGARRFVFEGRECGGHVGPRSSFVLWETMCGILLDHIGAGRGDDLHVVFAGGVHDALSASMVATLSAALAEKGAKIGALMGTAYLFTHEALAAGAIVPRFQQEAVDCSKTVLLETAPGHAIRCVPSPYCETFEAEKARLRAEGKSREEIVKTLEWMNVGRLRVASKGLDRVTADGAPRLAAVGPDEQFNRGMYMIGQVAAMHDQIVSMAALHADVCDEGTRRLQQLPAEALGADGDAKPCDIALIGMACFYPGATGVSRYWHNILRKHYAVSEVPASHWDWRLYYSEDPKPQDKFISKWGGFLDDISFDPFRYGITPKTMEVIEPVQLYLLEAVRLAIQDAGYAERPFNRDKTAAILGIGGGGSPMAVAYGFRTCLPLLDQVPDLPMKSADLLEHAKPLLPTWTEDSFPGILMNVAAGRVANRFNLGGPNYALDAACASSLAALYNCVRELETGASDVAIAMGADTVQTPYSYMAFSKTHALSRKGRCRPFDAQADGIVLSEGVSAVMLKRLADAERDGDRIYAVIRGMGCSSDGKDKGLTAPNAKGQVLALRRAYAKAGVSPTRLELIEAHGTGTVAGDKTEAEALKSLMVESGASPESCAIGSVKSMIGHSKCAAGLAGLIKTALALHKKVLPPTLVEKPNPLVAFDDNPLYLNTDSRPWVQASDSPRLAGVSAFGFGGTNYHVVLEEYTRGFMSDDSPALDQWPAELCVWRRGTRAELAEALRGARAALEQPAAPALRHLAAGLWKDAAKHHDKRATADHALNAPADLPAMAMVGLPTIAIVAASVDELRDKLSLAIAAVESDKADVHDPRGVYFAERPAARGGKLAMVFPGQGSQYANMLAEQAMNFAEVRQSLDDASIELAGRLEKPLGRFIYPPSAFDEDREKRSADELARTDVAQPALGAASLGMFRLLESLGLKPDFLAGHSYGEYAALAAAGVLDEAACIRLSHLRGRIIRDALSRSSAELAAGNGRASDTNPSLHAASAGGMAAIEADAPTVEQLLAGIDGVVLANLNSPRQTVVAARGGALDAALERCRAHRVNAKKIAVSCAFHSPWIAKANEPLAAALSLAPFTAPQVPVYSNTTADVYPGTREQIAALLAKHLVSPVRFQDQIEAMYAAGARIFVEVGPQSVLTNLIGQTLAGRAHLAAASDVKGRDGLVQLCHLLGQLLVHGVAVQLDRLFAGRDVAALDSSALAAPAAPELRGPWVVNSVRAKPASAPEPLLLGQSIPAERMTEFQPKRAHADEAARRQSAAAPSQLQSAPTSLQPAPSSLHAAPHRPAAAAVSHKSTEKASAMHEAPTNGVLPPGSVLTGDDEVAQVMLGYQNLMARFLDTQRAVMMAYLQSDVSHDAAHAVHAASNGAALTKPAGGAPNDHGAAIALAPTRPAAAADAPASANENGHAATAKAIAPTNRFAIDADAPATLMDGPAVAAASGAPRVDQPAAEAAAPAFERVKVSAQLLDLVSARTGYPHEMLDVDLDLEADLGIDSIKRVEILRDLAELLGITQDGGSAKIEFERLTSIRTIRGILDYLEEVLTESAAAGHEALPSSNGQLDASQPNTENSGELHIQRGLLELVDAPLPERGSALIPSGAVLLTDDACGVATEVATRLANFVEATVFIRQRRSSDDVDGHGVFYADLADEASVADLAMRIRREVGAIGALIHLLPLAAAAQPSNGRLPADAAPAIDPMARLERDVKSLYLLARELEDDLRQAGKDGGAMLLAATALGGGMGLCDAPHAQSFAAVHGGVAGLLKCVGQEWPEVLVRAIDLDGQRPPAELAERILEELSDRDGPREVGHLDGRRITWTIVNGAFSEDREREAIVDSSSTLLITGGGRGITSAIAEELARQFHPKLVLVGRSPAPERDESAETAHLSTPAEIKAALIARFKSNGQQAAPAAIESEYARLMRDRELRGALARIHAAGSQVIYRSADVRDRAALAAVIDEAESLFGPVTGIVHGAGVIEDKLLRDKTPASFDRVVGTKVASALALSDLVDLDRLKFFAMFSSVASRYGNRGQCDYAAANEVLSKLAWRLDREKSCRVFAVDWGPWSSIGMVADLEKHLVARGLTLISPEVGVRFFVDELVRGRKGESEVIIGGGAERLAAAPRNEPALAV